MLHSGEVFRAFRRADWGTALERHGVPIESNVSWEEGDIGLYFRDMGGHVVELKSTAWDSKKT